MRAMLTATPVLPPATSSPSALTAALVPRDVQVDFDDKTRWEYLFKVYWVLLKEKLALTLDELTNSTNPWKELREASANIEPKHQNDVADLINSYKSLYPKWVFDLRTDIFVLCDFNYRRVKEIVPLEVEAFRSYISF
ncbi:hypothetical protein V6Z11_D01G085100 [Gossypium hirsutum]